MAEQHETTPPHELKAALVRSVDLAERESAGMGGTGLVAFKPVSEVDSVISMVERASRDPSVDIVKFQALMEMKERVEERQAERLFNAAVAAAKQDVPTIRKNRTVDFTSPKGRTHYKHEDLGELARVLDPVLSAHGLSYRFRSTQDKGVLTVTCILSHAAGHREETTLTAGEDHSGNKNSIQAIGSVATYLQRYTLKLALGLAASNDDDGRSADETPAQAENRDARLAQMKALITETGASESWFCNQYDVGALDDMTGDQISQAITGLMQRKRRAKT